MSNWTRSIAWILAIAWVGVDGVCGAAGPTESAGAASAAEAVSVAEIAALVEQLDADSFAQRQAAGEKLGRIGQPAIDALAKAAAGDSLEVTVRAVDLLRDMLKANDEATRTAARAALEELVKGPRTAASGRAARALQPAEEPLPPGAMVPPMAQLGPGGAIQIAVAGAGMRKVTARTINGVRTIEAEEGGQRVKIVESPNEGIKLQVTSKKDGKEVTETFDAKSTEELKKRHPEAHRLYGKYSPMGGMGAIAVQMQFGGNAQPVPIPVPVAAPPGAPIGADRILEAWEKTLEQLVPDAAIEQASPESNKALKTRAGSLRQQLEKLENRLQEAIEKANRE